MASNDTTWKPGQSGNPGGRKKDQHIVRDAARKYTQEALDTLVALMRNGKQEITRVNASNAILDRGWGKPAQAIVGGDEDDPPLRAIARIELIPLDGSGTGQPTE